MVAKNPTSILTVHNAEAVAIDAATHTSDTLYLLSPTCKVSIIRHTNKYTSWVIDFKNDENMKTRFCSIYTYNKTQQNISYGKKNDQNCNIW